MASGGVDAVFSLVHQTAMRCGFEPHEGVLALHLLFPQLACAPFLWLDVRAGYLGAYLRPRAYSHELDLRILADL